jgi:DNA-binding transcriptional LysR family regulator
LAEPDWDDFKLVLALSRGGSVAGAARILGVDSSTVSRRLASMEQALGACLVLRGGREFTLTAEGKTAVAAAEAMAGVATNAANAIRAAKTQIDGVVRVSVVPSMLRTLLPLLPLAAERHPKLSIEVSAAMATTDLAKGAADIAVRMTKPKEIDLVAKRGFEMGFGVFASKKYVERCGLPKSLEELGQHRVIQYIEPMLHLPWFRWVETFGDKRGHAARVDSTEMAFGLVASGAGIGVIPCFTGDSAEDLVRVFPEPVAFAIGWIVYHETSRNSARIRAVIDMLAEFFETQKSHLHGRRA